MGVAALGEGRRAVSGPLRHLQVRGAGGDPEAFGGVPHVVEGAALEGTALAEPLQRCSSTEQRRTQEPTRLPRQRLPQQRPAHALVGVALLCLWPMSDAPTMRQRSPMEPTTLQRESDMATHRHTFRSSREGRRRLRGVGLGRQSKPLPEGSRTPVDSCHPTSVLDGCAVAQRGGDAPFRPVTPEAGVPGPPASACAAAAHDCARAIHRRLRPVSRIGTPSQRR